MKKSRKFKSVHSFGHIFYVVAVKMRYGHLENGFVLLEQAKNKAMTELLPVKAKAEETLGIKLIELDKEPYFSLGYSDKKSDYLIAYMAFYNANWFSTVKDFTNQAPFCCFCWCNGSLKVDVALVKSSADAINFGRQLPTLASGYKDVDYQFTPGRCSVHAHLFVRNDWALACEDLFKA